MLFDVKWEKRPHFFNVMSESVNENNLRGKRVLLGCTGSVASVKIPELVDLLMHELQCQVEVVSTKNALSFFDYKSMPVKVHLDEDEWNTWQEMGDPVLHIELRRWADVLLIAPLDANTMAKITQGICDNLLTCTVRAWDLEKPLLYAPAMNTHMWEHPITARQRQELAAYGYIEIPTICKKLACGDTGYGAMAALPSIVQNVKETLEKRTKKSS